MIDPLTIVSIVSIVVNKFFRHKKTPTFLLVFYTVQNLTGFRNLSGLKSLTKIKFPMNFQFQNNFLFLDVHI